MPLPFLGRKQGGDSDGAEPVTVCLFVQPRDNLPRKIWEVEIGADMTIKDLKSYVKNDYMCDEDIMKICGTKGAGEAGYPSAFKVGDLPNNDDRDGSKRVHLQAQKGKEDGFLDAVLDWAYRGEILDEYEAAGCVYTPKAPVPMFGTDTGHSTNLGRAGSVKSALGNGMGSLGVGSFGLGGLRGAMKNRRAHIPKAQMKQDGDKLTMEDPPPSLIEQMPFNVVCSCICVLNMLVVGFEADYTCWGLDKSCKPGDRMQWYALDCIFAMLFVVEVAIRIACTGVVDYFLGDPLVHLSGMHIPNTVDFFIVFFRFLDTFAFDQLGMDTKIKVISCLRIMQLANVARLMRLVRSIRELWLVIAGLQKLMKTVMWVMVLLLLIFWVVGIMMTIIVGHSEEHFDYSRSYWGKSAYFDTVPKSVYSLFQTMTLAKWSSIMYRPIFEVYPAIFVLIVPFLCITTIGLLNIIVGVVVETTLSSAANNKEKEGKEMLKMHARVMESLKMVFEEADTDGGGTLDRDELRKSLKKPHVRDRLRVLDIPIKDLDQLFDVLDEEKVGEIKTDHFFRGCSRLRGPALSCDLHRMSVDFARYIGWTDDLVNKTRATNDRLSHLLNDMESVDRDIIKGDADDQDPVLGSRRDRSAKRSAKFKEEEQDNANARSNTKATTGSKGTAASRRSSRKNSLMSRTLGFIPTEEDESPQKGNDRQVRISG